MAEGVVAVFGDLLAVEADALQAALGVVGQFARGAVWVRLPAASLVTACAPMAVNRLLSGAYW